MKVSPVRIIQLVPNTSVACLWCIGAKSKDEQLRPKHRIDTKSQMLITHWLIKYIVSSALGTDNCFQNGRFKNELLLRR